MTDQECEHRAIVRDLLIWLADWTLDTDQQDEHAAIEHTLDKWDWLMVSEHFQHAIEWFEALYDFDNSDAGDRLYAALIERWPTVEHYATGVR